MKIAGGRMEFDLNELSKEAIKDIEKALIDVQDVCAKWGCHIDVFIYKDDEVAKA